jgi:hypothetical protein
MSLSNRIILPIFFSTLAILAGCGSGGGNPVPQPPPSGSFSNTDLNGFYTFSVAGANVSGVFAMAGTLVACGCSAGTITSGTVDLLDPTGPAVASPIGNNSTYSITPDGRGTARLFIDIGGFLDEIDLDFVLTSSSHGLVIRFDGNGTGSGSIDLSPADVAQGSLTATPYAFFLSGGDLSNFPLSTVGAFSLNSSGAISTGVEDFNHDGTASTQLVLSGSLTVGTGTDPGTAILITTFGTFQFSVYSIDANHLKLIENDGQAVLVGDVLAQPSTTVPAGNLVFTMSGLDSNSDLFATLGIMTSDGASQISNGVVDVNDAGLVDNGSNPATPYAFDGSFSATGGGRYLFTMNTFVGGSLFAAYPSSGGLLMLEVDGGLNAGVTGGVAVKQQPGATVNAAQGYGLNLTGEDVPNFINFDEIAEFTTTSTGMQGLVDANDAGGLFTTRMNGTYSVGTDGFGSATFNPGGFAGMFFYAVDDSTALLISTDSTQAALGSFEMQTPSASAAKSSAMRAASMPMLRVIPHSTSQKNRSRGSKTN